MQSSWRALMWIGLSVLCALSLWYSASVIATELRDAWRMDANAEAWLSASIPAGFVIGSLVSSFLGIADRFNPRNIFAISAFSGALLNGLVILASSSITGILLRILTGITLAGVYPIAVKMLSGWFPKKRGLAIGILIAALTLGTSLPHFIIIFSAAFNWKMMILCSSGLALLSAFIILFLVEDTPVTSKNMPFSVKLMKKVVTNKPVMLANYGYFGHTWELYAMWTWLPSFLTASFLTYSAETTQSFIALASFTSIGIAGGIGCVAGGLLSDRIGRANLTIISMAVSSVCCVAIGFTFGKFIWLTLLVSIVWGASIIADSAQFSAAVSESAETEYVGTALTFQMCIGFSLTIISINLVPVFQKIVGWEWVFTLFAVGPVLGIIAMLPFKRFESTNRTIGSEQEEPAIHKR